MNSPESANASLLGSIILGIMNLLTPQGVDIAVKVITCGGALFSAFLAGRYYWYAAKEKKRILKKMDENK